MRALNLILLYFRTRLSSALSKIIIRTSRLTTAKYHGTCLLRRTLSGIFLYKMHNHFVFEAFIQILILLSSIKLVVDAYTENYPPTSVLIRISNELNYIITGAFAGESLVKSISLGFVMDRGTYLRDNWSKLDFFIVTTSMIDVCFSSINIPFIKVLRLLRVLRALRVVSHNSEMKT